MILYAVMYTVNADWTGALYADGKVTLVGLTEAQIAVSTREKNRVDKLGFNPTNDPEQGGLSTAELSATIDTLVAQDPNLKMLILSQAQGRWLHVSHPLFKPKVTEEN